MRDEIFANICCQEKIAIDVLMFSSKCLIISKSDSAVVDQCQKFIWRCLIIQKLLLCSKKNVEGSVLQFFIRLGETIFMSYCTEQAEKTNMSINKRIWLLHVNESSSYYHSYMKDLLTL